jgi:hypothetical protein
MTFAGYGTVSPQEAPQTSTGAAVGGGAASIYEPEVGQAEDIGKGFVGGLGRGTAGLTGIGGTVGGLVRSGLSYAGVPDEYLNKGAAAVRTLGYAMPAAALLTGPDAGDMQKSMESVTGKFYEPKTVLGQYASTLGEFAPGMVVPGGGGIVPRLVNTAVGALGSETAGQITKGTKAEPYARFMGGILTPFAAGKAITPMAPASAAHQADVAILDAAGVPLTAGRRTGSKALQTAESNAIDMPLSSRAATDLQANQASGFDRAVTNRVYDRGELTNRGVPQDVNLPDPIVATHGPASLGDRYTQLSQNPMQSNPQMLNRMTRAQNEYERLVLPPDRSARVQQTRDNIVDRLVAQQGQMAGDEYQAIRSQLGKNAKNATNPQETRALTEMKRAMDEAMQAGLPPAEARAWVENNNRYRLMKQTEDAVAAGQATGHLSPDKVAQGLKSRRGAQYSSQQGDLDELTQAATRVLKPIPNSGTAARLGAQKLFDIPKWAFAGGAGATAGGVAGLPFGPLGAMAGAAAGAAAPMVASRFIVSRPGQAWLGNQAMPQNARDILAQTMMQQAASQPSGIARQQAADSAYENKRKQDELRRIYITGR